MGSKNTILTGKRLKDIKDITDAAFIRCFAGSN